MFQVRSCVDFILKFLIHNWCRLISKWLAAKHNWTMSTNKNHPITHSHRWFWTRKTGDYADHLNSVLKVVLSTLFTTSNIPVFWFLTRTSAHLHISRFYDKHRKNKQLCLRTHNLTTPALHQFYFSLMCSNIMKITTVLTSTHRSLLLLSILFSSNIYKTSFL